MQSRIIVLLTLTVLLLGSILMLEARGPKEDRKYSVSEGITPYSLWNINNISGWIRNDGLSAHTPSGNSGITYPRQTAQMIYQDGILWGGFVRDNDPTKPGIRVGGQTYNAGTTSGYVLTPGPNPTPSSPMSIYRIRRDYQNLTTSSPDVILDAAEINQIDPSQVTTQQAQDVLDQYALDWQTWPAGIGAPFYDNNNNGTYEPAVDEPGLANADQVVWFVTHDLDESTTVGLYGSPPMGLEIQTTMWGYKGDSGSLANMTFQRYRIINKSGYAIDSTFVTRWSDPDVGNFTNDLAGCDTVRNMGYAYNGFPVDDQYDAFGLAPAAAGYALLQGPIVSSPGDSATVNFQRIADFKNLQMTSFGHFSSGTSIADPGPFGDYEATEEWYSFMNGYIPNTNMRWIIGAGPNTGQETAFPLSGDPLTNIGDVDNQGNNLAPGDRRIFLTSGPFYMQPGDTQEVIYAAMGGLGESHLESVEKLREHQLLAAALQKDRFRKIPTQIELKANVVYGATVNEVRFRAINNDLAALDLNVRDQNETLVADIQMFDDGLHNDGAAGDGVWGASWSTTPFSSGLTVDLDAEYQAGFSFLWEKAEQKLSTSGPVVVKRILVGSDNLNEDGNVNPGENIRYTLEVENRGSFNYPNVSFLQLSTPDRDAVKNLKIVNGLQIVTTLPANASYSWLYNTTQPYMEFTIDAAFPGNDSVRVVYRMEDENANRWQDTLSIYVAALSDEPQDYLMTSVAGSTEGKLGFRIFDPALVTGDTYRVSFDDTSSGGEPQYSLENLTAGTQLLSGHPYPDEFPHNSVPTDGFLVTRGETTPEDVIGPWVWEGGERWLTGVDWGGNIFFGGVDLGRNFFGSSVAPTDYKEIEIIFDSNIITNANVFNRHAAYEHAGLGTFQGAAYDVEDPANPRRLNIVFVEDANAGTADMIWNPTSTGGLGGREYLFIMDSDYNSVDGGGYTDGGALFGAVPTLWALWTQIRPGRTFLESPGTLKLLLTRGIAEGAIYEFTPEYLTAIGDETTPVLTFELAQNYPNPFNPETTIKFQIPVTQKVTLHIFNVLGQKVTTLVDDKLSAGSYDMRWDGRSQSGNIVSSGVYFYRIEAGDFVKTRKMLLVR
ncbi:MAG: T9SS type A sorting domain-containing protein [Calditrichia bacterium]